MPPCRGHRHTLVYGALKASIVGIYVLVVGSLAGFTGTVGAARNLLLRGPAAADVVPAELGTAIAAAVGIIRRATGTQPEDRAQSRL